MIEDEFPLGEVEAAQAVVEVDEDGLKLADRAVAGVQDLKLQHPYCNWMGWQEADVAEDWTGSGCR